VNTTNQLIFISGRYVFLDVITDFLNMISGNFFLKSIQQNMAVLSSLPPATKFCFSLYICVCIHKERGKKESEKNILKWKVIGEMTDALFME
jgi:hypothetical protein